jgi:hypothetical protein
MCRAFLTHTLANLLWRSGDGAGAHRLYAETLSAHRELGFGRHIADLLEEMAAFALSQGGARRAARLAGAAATVRETFDAPIEPQDLAELERVLDEARRAAGAAEVDGALDEGRAMSVGDAIAYAVGANSE